MAFSIAKIGRQRSSTGASRGLNADEQATDTASLILDLTPNLPLRGQQEIIRLCGVVDGLQRELVSATDSTPRDTFRRGGGFEALLHAFQNSTSTESWEDKELGDWELLTPLMRKLLNLLLNALSDHRGNQKYFTHHVHGWSPLQGALSTLQSHLLATQNEDAVESLRGVHQDLLAISFSDSSFKFSPEVEAVANGQTPIFFPRLQVPESSKIAIQLGLDLLRVSSNQRAKEIASSTIRTLNHVVGSNPRSRADLWKTGALDVLLAHALDGNSIIQSSADVNGLFLSLSSLGISGLDHIALLWRRARDSEPFRKLLLSVLERSKEPAFIQFDLALSGYSSLELPALPRAFPPANGYSLVAWIRIDEFDSNCHTTIFGAFDSSQTCFVLLYLEKDSHQLILQTSIRAAKPSVRFKAIKFEPKIWYHIALVHRKDQSDPRSSPAALFINGDFAEQVACTFPEAPPEVDEMVVGRRDATHFRRPRAVQAFLATPHDLATTLGRNKVRTRWSLGSIYLYQAPVSDEFVAVHHRLGPRYQGNLQDCLGPLLTYKASAELNRYNELLHPEKNERSDIVTATERRGGDILTESRILISLNPHTVISMEGSHGLENIKQYELDRRALQRYEALRLKTRVIAINGAIPNINEAISRSYGTGILTGEPAVIIPKALDDSTWSLAGAVPALIRLLESATTRSAFLDAAKIFIESVRDNWRVSEAMERGHGYGMFAVITREKLGLETISSSSAVTRRASAILPSEDRQSLPSKLLSLILEFVGYNKDQPEKSMIINPMAYRVLLLDFDTWRRCNDETQLIYYTQFVHFATHNVHSAFNQKRLNRMRAVRKLLEPLKIEDIVSESVPDLMRALKALVQSTPAWKWHCRDMAMFVAYALQDARMSALVRPMRSIASVATLRQRSAGGLRGVNGSRPTTPGGFVPEKRPCMPRAALAVKVLELLTELICDEKSVQLCKRFYDIKNGGVPNRWLLHLLAENDEKVIHLTLKILARSFVVMGPDFKTAFVDRNGGFVILKNRMRALWRSAPVWVACFAILFGCDVPGVRLGDDISLFSMVDAFMSNQKAVVHSEILPTIMGMLETGLKSITQSDEPSAVDLKLLKAMIQFLSDVYTQSAPFRDFAHNSRFVQDLLFVLYPVLVGSDRLAAETELSADKDSLSFKGEEVRLRPHANSVDGRPPSVRSLKMDETKNRTPSPLPRHQVPRPRRLSSFILINHSASLLPTQFSTSVIAKTPGQLKMNTGNATVEALLDVCVNLFVDIICSKRDFQGTGLFLKVPPGFREHQAYFESYILVNTLSSLWNHLQMNQPLLVQSKALTNLSRYSQHMAEALFEGWFIDGAQAVLDFTGKILEYLQQPNIASMNEVRLCSHQTTAIRVVFLRVTLWRLSELDEESDEKGAVAFLDKMNYWQTILFSSENQETLFMRLICYLLYTKIVSPIKSVRLAAARMWRTILVQKPTESATLLTFAMGSEHRHLTTGFMKLASTDEADFVLWIDQNRTALDDVFVNALSKPWDDFVNDENHKNEETAKNRLAKRREKLRHWSTEENSADEILHRYETSTQHWRTNVHAQERLKLQRTLQDQQENTSHLLSVFSSQEKAMHHASGLEPQTEEIRWQLDETESANRMRMRIIPDNNEHKTTYQPKRKASEGHAKLSINTKVPQVTGNNIMSALPPSFSASPLPSPLPITAEETSEDQSNLSRQRSNSVSNSQLLDGGFEMVEDPNENEYGMIEDKNRKIMTRLQRGDECQQLYNISRIVGLEACEGLVIVGKTHLYMQDNYFQRSDGEIVSVVHAPDDERDPYVQLISGKDLSTQIAKVSIGEEETRHWTWVEVLSVSKRRFLFRDVSLEVFFADGRSYLLTCISTKIRDDLYSAILARAPHIHSTSTIAAEDAWRLDTLRNPEEGPQTFGSKMANVFNSSSIPAATKKWVKGEMSNFQYLMLVNTMAGRTFNDLTQYPVFPWILANYSSEELDLDNPKTFRDLSKPMGCQTPSREAEYRERYQQFAEMGDENAPAFHYGTHYSSAMIVSSYLIRLQPFVQSYLLLQGGSFDHADRLFDSIERAWLSASRDAPSDVRELTPEFFYLPEFLVNANKYDFGVKQGHTQAVNNVELPRWAKGDPHVFVAKHREALESPHVSQHLHQWIDLVFGFKQRGEHAVEAANVFQHLSYQGAKNLDAIDDPVERLASIGIIHSFGQTPHQVFQKPHPMRDAVGPLLGRMDRSASFLIRLPDPVFESDEKVMSLAFSPTQERLLCAGPGKLNMLPNCDRFMQWGFTDHSMRFYSSNTKRLVGLYENSHVGPISTATFPDSRTLVTGGVDCSIAVWSVEMNRDIVTLNQKAYLFGHRAPVTVLTASRVCSTLVSASSDGHVMVWGLNRLNCVRVLHRAGTAPIQAARVSNVSGHIALCQGPYLMLYTLNGHLLVKQKICDNNHDIVHSCAFYEGAGNEWLEQELIFTGHAHGTANVWALTTLTDGAWYLQLVKRMNHTDPKRGDGANSHAAITAIMPMPQAVFTGDEDGRVWEWDCVQKQMSFGGKGR